MLRTPRSVEVVQAALLPLRSGDPTDVVADLVGVALGWAGTGRARARLAPLGS